MIEWLRFYFSFWIFGLKKYQVSNLDRFSLLCMQSIKDHEPYKDQMVNDPFLYDLMATVVPPPELLISSDLEYLLVFKGFKPFLLL
jgi:hypothetical protein